MASGLVSLLLVIACVSPFLVHPSSASNVFEVLFTTTVGKEQGQQRTFTVQVHPDWAPLGARRFYELVKDKYFDDNSFFRVLPGFVVQFGLSNTPSISAKWANKRIPDDKVIKSNTRGMLTFAHSGKHSRSTQLFINLGDNSRLDGQVFAPFGKVVEGMDVVDAIFAGDREKPNQGRIHQSGGEYLSKEFPKLDRVITARIIEQANVEGSKKATVQREQYVRCSTTKGDLLIQLQPSWSPLGVQRFLDMVQGSYMQNIGLFRAVPNFLIQFGISGDPAVTTKWRRKGPIKDDPNLHRKFSKGTLSFAGSGPHSRTTELFLALGPVNLGNSPWETPLGQVVQGLDVLDRVYKGYGDVPPFGKGPSQQRMYAEGNAYLKKNFPLLDYITQCELTDAPSVVIPSVVTLKPPQQKKQDESNRKFAKRSVGAKREVAIVHQRPDDALAQDQKNRPVNAAARDPQQHKQAREAAAGVKMIKPVKAGEGHTTMYVGGSAMLLGLSLLVLRALCGQRKRAVL